MNTELLSVPFQRTQNLRKHAIHTFLAFAHFLVILYFLCLIQGFFSPLHLKLFGVLVASKYNKIISKQQKTVI